MTGNQRSGVFLSYARKDGEQFAAALRERLLKNASDIDIKQDRVLLEGGVGWWKQLTDAIESVEFLVLVMTPSAMQSETVRKEWRYARQQGVCVYPVKAASDAELKFSDLPRWMKKAHFFDLDKEWESFVAHLRKGCDSPRVPFMAPDLPENFVQREKEFQQLKNQLLTADRKEPVAITTAISGAGGFGKTTVASAICHDEDIIQNFDDGILWVTLGQSPNVMSGLVTAYAALTGDRPGFASEEDAAFQLGQKLEDRTCLFVIDDVWDESHLRPFLRGGKSCARLFTTRNAEIASSKARPVNVEEMSRTESETLIAKGMPGLSAAHARELSKRLGEWPIAIELAGAMMRQRIEQGDTAERAAQRLLLLLEKKGPRGLAKGTGTHRTIDSVLQGSFELLTQDDRTRLTELSIFPEDVSIPLTAAASLWGLDEFDTEDNAQRFARLYLLKLDLSKGSIRLHDVLQDWLSTATSNAGQLHDRLVSSWPDWMRLPGTYAWRWLPWHLAKAGRNPEIEKLLWNAAWLKAKLAATDLNALIADFEYLKGSPEAVLIQGALRLSSHVIAKDPAQLPSQVIGRLLPHSQHLPIQQFLVSLAQAADRPWLRPMWAALDPPGTSLIRTMAGHRLRIDAVAASPAGRYAVSASRDNTLKVWDLDSGAELRDLIGHSGAVHCVAISTDGSRAVSGSDDMTLKVWDLESGAEVRTLAGHSGTVHCVAVTPDGRRAVSGSEDKTLTVWDLETGAELRTLSGHTEPVHGVAVTPDSRRAVSASWDNTLRVWDLETGAALLTLSGHSNKVYGVTVTPDGRCTVSASEDGTIKIWDLKTGQELRSLAGHRGSVRSVTVTADGKHLVSGSWDKTLKLWDVQSGNELRTLSGHSDTVNSVQVSVDGHLAVSSSEDGTLKVWDLETGTEPRTPSRHSSWIHGVAVAADGKRAVSAAWDYSLKIWDLETGAQLGLLTGHDGPVNAVAITADGKRAVSASHDETLRVWDLSSATELRKLTGHTSIIRGLALMADGRRVISACEDSTLKVWDLESGAELMTLAGHTEPVLGVAVSPDGRLAVSSSADSTLKVWNLNSGALLRTLTGHYGSIYSVAVLADGAYAISASSEDTMKVWDLENGTEVGKLAGHSSLVNQVAASPDEERLVSVSDDKTLKIWDLKNGTEIATFTCDASPMCCRFVNQNTVLAGDRAGHLHFLAIEIP